jgi:hypothetical protein
VLDEATMAIITGAAGNVAAYMLNGRVDALRGWVSKIFRRESAERRSAALNALEAERVAVLRGSVTEAEITARWSMLLASLLAQYPDVRDEISAMADVAPPASMINIGSQHNHGPGTFIGGNHYGSINAAGVRGAE